MNYQKIYNQLIAKRQVEILSKKEVYCETHHIIPKCLDGSNEDSNLVNLTAREHFLAHWLLHRIYPENSSLTHAFFQLSIGNSSKRRNFYPSSKAYEEARIAFSISQSKKLKNKKQSLEHIAKRVAKNKNQKRSVEQLKTLSDAQKKVIHTKEWNSKISIAKLGIPNYSARGKKNERKICEYCKEEFAINIYNQYHGIKCKENPNITKELLDNRKSIQPKQKLVFCSVCKYEYGANVITRYHNEKCSAEDRKCKNPNCDKIFHVSKCSYTKRYCSRFCQISHNKTLRWVEYRKLQNETF